jgi:hypothetical protein
MAKLTKTIFGVVDGEIYPREIEAGKDCPLGLEAYAASIDALDGPATPIPTPEPEPTPEPTTGEPADVQPEDTKAAKKAPETK